MKVFFTEKSRDKILASIKAAMGDRELGKMVTFGLGAGKLEVTISKFGTSTIQFAEKETDKGVEYVLSSEKIAFTHKAFKDDVTNKIMNVIKKAGGQVT